jgi:hypothetical protein
MIKVYVEKTLWGYVLSFDYDERVVSAIKSRVKPENRHWDPLTKTWTIETKDAFDNFRWATNGWIAFYRKKQTA